MSQQIDYKMAMAAGQDAANKSAKAAGRSAWNDDDWSVAAELTNKLLTGANPAVQPHLYVDTTWDLARRSFSLPDTEATRTAFFLGARNALDIIADCTEGNEPKAIAEEIDALRGMFASRISEDG